MGYRLKRFTEDMVTELKPNEVFVFGSNVDGWHGAGAALTALKFGAVMGEGYGYFGNTYAIATKDLKVKTLRSVTLEHIKEQVLEFKNFARTKPELTFLVTKLGTDRAGFSMSEIAGIFHDIDFPINVVLPLEFVNNIEDVD